MKVLAIIGSPRRKGNTYQVVEEVKSKILNYDRNIDFQYLFLKDHHIMMCTGCFVCIAQGEDKCPLKDDCKLIADKMRDAQGIIFAAPTYAMGVPGLMKNFIDRFAYTCHRPAFFDKTIMAVSTVGGVKGVKQTLEQLSILAGGGRLAYKLGVSSPPIPMGVSERKAKRDIEKASKAFYLSLIRREKKLPGPADWAWFHSFKTLCGYKSYQRVCPADHSYYNEKAEYFYPVEGHPLRRLLGKAFKTIMKLSFGFMIDPDDRQ